jgi:flagellar hook protein FlgE
MSMLRSMDAAVSGLRNHQVRMDIIGNNIANINTVGYKASRVTFEESLSQLLQGSTRPPGDGGGTNPVQVGMGMSVGSVDMLFTQGNLESTGQVTDLAIEGDAFFAVSNGEGNFYTRNGAFQLDANGQMVLPTNGFVLQGKMAAQDGTFPPGTVVENIVIPLNEQTPAHATEEINFGKNLDSDSQALGSVHYSQSFLHHTQGNDLLVSLKDSNGQSLNIQIGDTLSFTGDSVIAATGNAGTFTVTATSQISDLTAAMEAHIRGADIGLVNTNVTVVDEVDPLNADYALRGAIRIDGNTLGALNNFQVISDNPESTGFVTKAFSFPAQVAIGTPEVSDYLRSPATLTDELYMVYDSGGNDLGLFGNGTTGSSDSINFRGEIGGTSANNVTALDYNSTMGAGTTMQNLVNYMSDNFRLPSSDGTLAANQSVEVNQAGTDDNIPDGSIVVRGMPGTDFALDNISVRASEIDNLNPSPTNFNKNFNFTSAQEARDPKIFDTSITIFDESGDDHIVTMKFVPTQAPGVWQWNVDLAGDETPLGGNQGELIFDQDGTVSSFTFDDNEIEFSFDPNNGSNVVRTKLDVGGPGDFRGLTQFRSPTTATITGQDGYTTGSLREISVGEDGMVSGIFTNGLNKPLAQVLLVDFINPGGLMKVSDSVFSVSSNSGDPVFVNGGNDQSSKIKPGALEISNVELAAEFTEMITTQRGYQANARGITVSDSLLEELVNLKR